MAVMYSIKLTFSTFYVFARLIDIKLLLTLLVLMRLQKSQVCLLQFLASEAIIDHIK